MINVCNLRNALQFGFHKGRNRADASAEITKINCDTLDDPLATVFLG